MAMYDYEDEDEGTDLIKQLRKQLKDQSKALDEKDRELAGLRQKETQRTVAETFSTKGVNPALARFALVDLQDDITEESVGRWIEENGSLFGVQAAPPQQGAPAPVDAEPYRRMAAVEQAAAPGIPGDIATRIAIAESEDEVWAALGGGRNLI